MPGDRCALEWIALPPARAVATGLLPSIHRIDIDRNGESGWMERARQKRSTERPSRANGGVRGARALACAVLQPVGRLGEGRGVAADWRWGCGTDAAAHALHPACFISVRRALSGDAGGDARLGRLDLGRRARERAPRAARGSAAPRGRALRHAGPRQLHRARRWRCAPPHPHTARCGGRRVVREATCASAPPSGAIRRAPLPAWAGLGGRRGAGRTAADRRSREGPGAPRQSVGHPSELELRRLGCMGKYDRSAMP